MKIYKKRQNKKKLKITKLKGISVINYRKDNGYIVKFRSELRRNGKLLNGGISDNIKEAIKKANNLFIEFYGTKRLAKKANYWNY